MALKDLLAAVAEVSASKRTSTKSGTAGLVALVVPLLVAAFPFKDQIDAFILQACASAEGPTTFFVGWLVGGGVVLLVAWYTARKSKTPPNPGVL